MKTVVIAAWLAAELAHLPGSRAPGETREEYVERAGQIATALAEEATPYANGSGWTSTELAAAGEFAEQLDRFAPADRVEVRGGAGGQAGDIAGRSGVAG